MIEGAVEAFDAFARARGPELLRYGAALAGSTEGGRDLVQEALARTLVAWPRVQSADPEGYVRRTMANLAVSTWRRRRRERLVAETPDTAYDDAAPRDPALWAALARVPARQRAVLVLRFCEDLSEAETARVLGCAPGTVKSQSSRGLTRLRQLLHEEVPA